MPFLTEDIYQNLEPSGEKQAEQCASVHLCDFPASDSSLIDGELSADMEALLRLVSLGLAARNAAKIKVRQPLAEMKIVAASAAERRAVARFFGQISEELNVKKVSLHDPKQGPLLQYDIKPNLKALGPRLGGRLKDVQQALGALDAAVVAEKIQAGGRFEVSVVGETIALAQSDLLINVKAPDGWGGLADGSTQVALDARITDELAREGTAREIVRHIQELRKKSGLEIEDRIQLYLQSDSPAVREAIAAHRDYICGETLAINFTEAPLDGTAHKAVVKLQDQSVTIGLRKAPSAIV
jgi:isoleucyl-tRNA synthetase